MKRLSDFFKINLREKLLALVVTVFVWIAISTNGENSISFTAAVRFVTNPDQVVTLARLTNDIHVSARGGLFDEMRIRSQLSEVVIDVTKKDFGRAVYFVEDRDIPGMEHLKVESVIPRDLSYTISRKITKTLSIEPFLDGQPKKGYKIGSIRRDPTTVEVSGPEEQLVDLESIATEKVDLTGTDRTVEARVRVQPSQPGIVIVGEDPDVSVTVAIERDIREFDLRNVPLSVDGEATAEVLPAFVGVRLKGPAELIDRLFETGLRAYVPNRAVPTYVENRYYFKNIPNGVEVLYMEPVKRITVRKKNP